jgi:hypothetical protein
MNWEGHYTTESIAREGMVRGFVDNREGGNENDMTNKMLRLAAM